MNEDFFDWLSNCPTNWFLNGDDEEGKTYFFVDNEDLSEVIK